MNRETRSFLIGACILVAFIIWAIYYFEVHFGGRITPQSMSSVQDDATLARFKKYCVPVTLPPNNINVILWSKCLGISSDGHVSALNYMGGDLLQVSKPGNSYMTTMSKLNDFTITFANHHRRDELLEAFVTQQGGWE